MRRVLPVLLISLPLLSGCWSFASRQSRNPSNQTASYEDTTSTEAMMQKEVPAVPAERPIIRDTVAAEAPLQPSRATPASAPAPAAQDFVPSPAPTKSLENGANDVKLQDYSVWIWQENGDCLWRIAEKVYGDRTKWRLIYLANKDLVPDPNKIYPRQKLKIPPADWQP